MLWVEYTVETPERESLEFVSIVDSFVGVYSVRPALLFVCNDHSTLLDSLIREKIERRERESHKCIYIEKDDLPFVSGAYI